jgi:DNA-directed RNA polymerase alpha subunit
MGSLGKYLGSNLAHSLENIYGSVFKRVKTLVASRFTRRKRKRRPKGRLSMKIDELDLNPRTRNILVNAGYASVAELIKLPMLKKLPNIRERELREVIRALARVVARQS